MDGIRHGTPLAKLKKTLRKKLKFEMTENKIKQPKGKKNSRKRRTRELGGVLSAKTNYRRKKEKRYVFTRI